MLFSNAGLNHDNKYRAILSVNTLSDTHGQITENVQNNILEIYFYLLTLDNFIKF